MIGEAGDGNYMVLARRWQSCGGDVTITNSFDLENTSSLGAFVEGTTGVEFGVVENASVTEVTLCNVRQK